MDTTGVDLELVIPVYNEEQTLERAVRSVWNRLNDEMPGSSWIITIADNGSTDATPMIARRLASEMPRVAAKILPQKGRGYALRTVWAESTARVRAYVDVDLSTDLAALPALIAPLLSGHSDLAIGTRLARGSRIVRGPKRDFISRGYNFLLHSVLGVSFSDAQCGFKAITAEAAEYLLPWVQDTQWFFDTELLTIAERAGLRIHEVPVDWIDDPDSRVNIGETMMQDLAGIRRMLREFRHGDIPLDALEARLGRKPLNEDGLTGESTGNSDALIPQIVRFTMVGVTSTLAYALLYLVLTMAMPAFTANFIALVVTAIGNTALNRAFTFGVSGRARLVNHHLQGLAIFGFSWLITSGGLWLLQTKDPNAATLTQLTVLTLANLIATAVRFIVFRMITFRKSPKTRLNLVDLPRANRNLEDPLSGRSKTNSTTTTVERIAA